MKRSIFGFILILLFVSPCVIFGSAVTDILDADYDSLDQSASANIKSIEPAKISAKLGYIWTLPDKTQTMVLLGNFRLEMPLRKISGRNAVIWLSVFKKDGKKIQKLDIFVEGGARVVDKAGSITEDEILYLTVFTAGKVELSSDSIARENGSKLAIYQRAKKVRGKGHNTYELGEKVIIHGRKGSGKKGPKARRTVAIRGNFVIGPRSSSNSEPVLVGTGGIYLLQSAAPGGNALEIHATNAVLFLKRDALSLGKGKQGRSAITTIPSNISPKQINAKLQALPTEEQLAVKQSPSAKMKANRYVSAAYLEGDVVLTRGYRKIRADRVYYDFEHSKAELLNVVTRTVQTDRNVPIYIRASEVKQLNDREFVARNAKLSTSEFHTPSYYVGSTTIYFTDKTERLANGEQVGLVAGQYRAYNATLHVGAFPILYWPYIRGNFKQSETSIKSISTAYDSEFGTGVKTRWYLLPLLGLEEPDGVAATLKLDYFGDRGPAVGIDASYVRDTYYGLIRSYYIHDRGEDHLGGHRGDVEPPYQNRGRFLIRHRQYLPENWELTLEMSYLSDKNFLEEYFRNEFEEGKEQETVLYLKKVFGDVAFSVLGKWRINDFQTQTEELPDVAVDVLGKQLFGDSVTWYSENHLGAVRRKIDNTIPWWFRWDDSLGRTDVVARGDTRQEFEVPLTVGTLKLVPFGVIRGSAWDDSPGGGGTQRVFGMYGVRGSTYQWKVYDDVDSRFWDLHGLRHIMKEDFTLWGAQTNRDSRDVFAFDNGIENISGADGFTFGWRNRLQTKRGGTGHWRSMDWLTVDLEAGFFNNAREPYGRNRTRGETFDFRPENSITSNYISLHSIWRFSDTASLVYDATLDTDNWRMGFSGIGLNVDRSPRLSWFIGHRFIGATESNLLAFGANYKLNQKYSLSLREEYDIDRGKSADTELSLVRKMPRWYLAMTVDFDKTENVDSVSLAIWPEGIPEWTIGSRRHQRILKYLPID